MCSRKSGKVIGPICTVTVNSSLSRNENMSLLYLILFWHVTASYAFILSQKKEIRNANLYHAMKWRFLYWLSFLCVACIPENYVCISFLLKSLFWSKSKDSIFEQERQFPIDNMYSMTLKILHIEWKFDIFWERNWIFLIGSSDCSYRSYTKLLVEIFQTWSVGNPCLQIPWFF